MKWVTIMSDNRFALGEYRQRPEGVQTGHGDIIPHIGVGYAVSRDGVNSEKPLGDLLIRPRGFDTEPYEYICSKPFVVHEDTGAFDSKQRCYACVVKRHDDYRCWYTGDRYGAAGIGYAVGRAEHSRLHVS